MNLIFLDSETNGLNPHKHKILEIAYKILDAKTGEHKLEFHAVVQQPEEVWKQSDPASLKVNGFTWEEVKFGDEPEVISQTIIEQFSRLEIRRGNAVFICQNPSFDRIFFAQLIDPDKQENLIWPYHWLDLASMYWKESMMLGKNIPSAYPWNTGFSKDKVAAAHGLPPENSPHRAMNGVDHLILCYKAVVGFPMLKEHNLF